VPSYQVSSFNKSFRGRRDRAQGRSQKSGTVEKWNLKELNDLMSSSGEVNKSNNMDATLYIAIAVSHSHPNEWVTISRETKAQL
jgi:hypothetical protein